ncbi:hypothetical protein NC99_00690 [Sunxiuqinia dokdonensis]|uniref:Uncharacterized protein n=1 Tax=Sunxiuqinia dokdonensis TaxID=1409788 RepID=A0A0L8VFF2_9BACT|nr:hypothetical protein NC99_00690 [Sunxiuqinia dokdonensis]
MNFFSTAKSQSREEFPRWGKITIAFRSYRYEGAEQAEE